MSSGFGIWPGYGLVFAATVLEFLGLPAPGGILVAIAAFQLAHQPLGLLSLIVVASLGSTVGDLPWYLVGRCGSARLLDFYCKFTLGSKTCVSNTESFFRRFGTSSLLFSKLLAGVRLFAPPMAGLAGYSLYSFLVLDWLGGILWAGFFVLSGLIFGPRLPFNISNQTILLLTIVPPVVFALLRLAKRAIRGSAEKAINLTSKSDVQSTTTAEAGARIP